MDLRVVHPVGRLLSTSGFHGRGHTPACIHPLLLTRYDTAGRMNRAALMSFGSGTNSAGFGIREIEVSVMTALLHIGPIGGFTALTDQRTQR
ncbi:hypothetical protein ACFZCP_20545 [Streptomyces sp. NPDC007971]|uniref:hypothetical protein n=1 Tax=Streptomyces sp. NPDC007971 TaxID=3364799 RepID=UPI0036EA4A39